MNAEMKSLIYDRVYGLVHTCGKTEEAVISCDIDWLVEELEQEFPEESDYDTLEDDILTVVQVMFEDGDFE